MKIAKLLAFALVFSFTANAQKSKVKLINQGRIVYDITLEGEMNPMMAAMMPTEMTMYMKDHKIRTELSGTGWSSVTIADTKERSNVTLIDMMGKKMAKKMNTEEVDKNYTEHKPTINILKETKDIAGFKCTKAEIVNSKGEKSYVYFTKAIAIRNGTNLNLRDLDGFLMEYQINQNGINMKVTAKGINGAYKVSDSMFVTPEGYEELSKDDIKKLGNK